MKYRVKSPNGGKLMPRPPNTSRAQQPKTAHMVMFDLREAARRWCPEALEVVAKCLSSKDEKVRLLAAEIMLNRGYGKPLVTVDANTTHAFVVAPEVMSEADWLRTRGNPQLLELSRNPEAAAREVCPDAAPTLDRKPSDEPDPSKLN
jgi:hypothetical protein